MTFVILAMLVIAILEHVPRLRFRVTPFLRARFGTDVLYLFTGYVAGASLALAYVDAGSRLVGRLGLPRLAGAGVPRCASVPLALVALDVGNYIAHWLLHRVDALWEFHKAHHSSPTLDWLATFRSHVVEQTLRRVIAPLLLIAAGFPVDAVAIAAALFLAWAMLNHSNLRLSLHFLEPLLVTPRLHRLHHVPRTTERNLGTVFTLWDRLRGTLVVADLEPEAVFGVPREVTSYPQGWFRQLLEPAIRLAFHRARSASRSDRHRVARQTPAGV